MSKLELARHEFKRTAFSLIPPAFPDAIPPVRTLSPFASGSQLPLTATRTTVPKSGSLSVVQLPLAQARFDAHGAAGEGSQLAHVDQRVSGPQRRIVGVCTQLPVVASDDAIPREGLPLSEPNPIDGQRVSDIHLASAVSGSISRSRQPTYGIHIHSAAAGSNFGGAA